jgi:hypothetical protein
MKHVNLSKGWRLAEGWTAAVVVLLLSPMVLIFCVPLAIGSGIDIFAFGEGPLALALCAPALFVLLRYVSTRSEPEQPGDDEAASQAHARPSSRSAVNQPA